MLNFDFYGLFDYDATGGETYEYTSEEFSSLIEGITGNGISANYLNEFEPTVNGLDITIKSGAAFLNGRWGYNSAAKTISLSPTTSTTKRIDRIVIELDVASRAIGLNTLVGTATTGTPTAPALNDNQIAVCSVLVANGSKTTLTDERVFTYSAAEVQKQLNEIKAKMGNLAFLPLAGGNMTGDIDFGNAANSGIQWTTDNGTRIRIRPYSPNNIFQITMKPSDGDEFGPFGMDTSGNVSLSKPLSIANGGTGATDAATARANLGAAAAEHTHAYLPLTGGDMTGGINFGGGTRGLAWTTEDGTMFALRPYYGGNLFQITRKPPNGTEVGAFSIDKNGNVGLGGIPLSIANGGTGASDATTARANLGAEAANTCLPLAGGTITGELLVSNNNSAAGYVRIFEDNEGGNIAIGSPDGHEFQFDAFNNEILRCFGYGDDNVVRGFSFKRTTGDFCTDGEFYANGKRVADVQHGVLDVGTSGKTITFPHAFAGVPSVVATGSKFCHLYVKDITETGCTLVSGEGKNTVQWIAVY